MKPIEFRLFKPSGKLSKGASRFWGSPDLLSVEDFPFYTDMYGDKVPYTFVCQINLADIAKFDVDNYLPHRGLLSIFAKIDYYLGVESDDFIGSDISDTDDLRVLYFSDYLSFDEVVVVDNYGEVVSPNELSIVFGGDSNIDEHMFFPIPTHRPWKTWDAPYEDWIVLLQIDSCEGADFNLNFMDCGVLNILISKEDLKQHRFDKVRAIVLSS